MNKKIKTKELIFFKKVKENTYLKELLLFNDKGLFFKGCIFL
jgi:hypothetical protein